MSNNARVLAAMRRKIIQSRQENARASPLSDDDSLGSPIKLPAERLSDLGDHKTTNSIKVKSAKKPPCTITAWEGHNGSMVKIHVPVPRLVDDTDVEYTDTLLFSARCKLLRLGGPSEGWVNHSNGTLSYFEERENGDKFGYGRLKFVQHGTHQVHLHAYVCPNMPKPKPHDTKPDVSRVFHAWSSTGDGKRTCFVVTFMFAEAASLFDAAFDRTNFVLGGMVDPTKKKTWKGLEAKVLFTGSTADALGVQEGAKCEEKEELWEFGAVDESQNIRDTFSLNLE